jgi:hypothetical protein
MGWGWGRSTVRYLNLIYIFRFIVHVLYLKYLKKTRQNNNFFPSGCKKYVGFLFFFNGGSFCYIGVGRYTAINNVLFLDLLIVQVRNTCIISACTGI